MTFRFFRSTGAKALMIAVIAYPAGVLAQSVTDDVITISQKRRKYAPVAVTIKPGDTLQYDSGSMEEGETRDIQFTAVGAYQVKCAIHPRMRLDVTVK
jgi:plastocyanin